MTTPTKRTNRTLIQILLICALLAVGIFADLSIMGSQVDESGESVWRTAALWITKSDYTQLTCFAYIIAFAVNTAAAVIGIYQMAVKHTLPLTCFLIQSATHIAMLILNSSSQILGGIGVFLMILYLLLALLGTAYCIIGLTIGAGKGKKGEDSLFGQFRMKAILAAGGISLLVTFSLFAIPFYTYTIDELDYSVIPLGILSATTNSITHLVVFTALFFCAMLGIVNFVKCFICGDSARAVAAKVRGLILLNTAVAGGYFVFGVAYCSFRNWRGGIYTTSSYLPFFIQIGIAIVFAFLARGLSPDREDQQIKTAKFARLELFIYGALVTALTVTAALTDIICVRFTVPREMEVLKLNGYKIFTTYESLGSGFQVLAFVLMAILVIMLALFLSSLVSFIGKSKFFYKLAMSEIICGALFSLLIGLFGKYYEIVQRINENMILSWIAQTLRIDHLADTVLEYKVQSNSFYWFLAVLAIAAIVLIRKPYTRGTLAEAVIAVNPPIAANNDGFAPSESKPTSPDSTPDPMPKSSQTADFDPCPAFTELDQKSERFLEELVTASARTYEAPTLQGLIEFLVSYARDSRLHLSYTPEDMAAFVAGLGSTRLTILQGMSGTGKTSLPKIFSEAVVGNAEIIEVESSWRDKHELLGYYNEFSRTYTPKKFTQALYKAALNPERLTFIVLDEMNLSRVEYYFSDFLSLMENEEDKREIKLLNIPLFRREKGKRSAYLGLIDGHTLKIPKNVWFIGTANRDESTFEISDKVYDRAHTMNFNKRAPKVIYRHEPLAQRYLSADKFLELIEEAKKTVRFDLDTCTVVREVEELLEPYNISFGNRVADQIESFVKIYCACFSASEGIMNDALERILLSKVVCKLEYKSVENKEALAASFRRLGLGRCSDYILKLNED